MKAHMEGQLELIVKKWSVGVWTGFAWLRTQDTCKHGNISSHVTQCTTEHIIFPPFFARRFINKTDQSCTEVHMFSKNMEDTSHRTHTH